MINKYQWDNLPNSARMANKIYHKTVTESGETIGTPLWWQFAAMQDGYTNDGVEQMLREAVIIWAERWATNIVTPQMPRFQNFGNSPFESEFYTNNHPNAHKVGFETCL